MAKYDYLVLATGVETTCYGHDEYKPSAPGLKSLDDTLEIRRHISLAYEAAEMEATSKRAQVNLEQMGVEIRLNSRGNGSVVGDETISAENVFWAASVQGVPLAGCRRSQNRTQMNADNR